MVTSDQDASADLKSKGSSDFRQLSDMLQNEESSEEEELYTDSLTSLTTTSDSTIGNLSSPLGPISSRVEDSIAVSKTESQFSSNMPYLEESTPSKISPSSNLTSTDDSVFVTETDDTSNNTSSPISSPAPPLPRRITRSTRGKPPERYGKVYCCVRLCGSVFYNILISLGTLCVIHFSYILYAHYAFTIICSSSGPLFFAHLGGINSITHNS